MSKTAGVIPSVLSHLIIIISLQFSQRTKESTNQAATNHIHLHTLIQTRSWLAILIFYDELPPTRHWLKGIPVALVFTAIRWSIPRQAPPSLRTRWLNTERTTTNLSRHALCSISSTILRLRYAARSFGRSRLVPSSSFRIYFKF